MKMHHHIIKNASKVFWLPICVKQDERRQPPPPPPHPTPPNTPPSVLIIDDSSFLCGLFERQFSCWNKKHSSRDTWTWLDPQSLISAYYLLHILQMIRSHDRKTEETMALRRSMVGEGGGESTPG